MKHLCMFLLAFTLVFAAMGQTRPQCIDCEDVEWVDVSTLVNHSKLDEIKVEYITDTVEYVAVPRHKVCSINPVTGALCTVYVEEAKAKSVAVIKKIISVQYVNVTTIEPARGIRFEAEIKQVDCH